MTIHAGRGSCDGFDFEIRDWMVDDFKIGFKIFELDLLEEYIEFVLNLLCFVEEVELLSFARFEVLIDELIDEFLELFGACADWHCINSQGLVFGVFELDPDVFRQLGLYDFVNFDFFVSLHLNNLL